MRIGTNLIKLLFENYGIMNRYVMWNGTVAVINKLY